MKRNELIDDIICYVEHKGYPLVFNDDDENALWVNNADGNGEDFKVYGVGYSNEDGVECMGVYVGEYDFFTLDELSYEELENLYEHIMENY